MAPRIAAGTVVGVTVLGLVTLEQLDSPELVVLCSNNVDSCTAVVARYEQIAGSRVTIVRMPTTEALARIRVPKEAGEFDVWMGGPAEAYTIAADEGLLSRAEVENADSIPGNLRDPDGRWYGIYGGILAFCAASDVAAPTTWDDLVAAGSGERVVVPNPMTSGTAFTMLSVQFERLGSLDAAMDYMSRLDSRAATYTDSGTVTAHVVASGRAGIGVTFGPYCETENELGRDVRTIYPRDGTGFEVGAIAILRESSAPDEAGRFVSFTISAEGQHIGAESSGQLPVSASIPGNLNARLDALDVTVFGQDIDAAGKRRASLIAAWAEKVRHGAY